MFLSFSFGSSHHAVTAPLKIVRAQKQYMIDVMGVEYLDCVSNIAHGNSMLYLQ